MNYVRKGVIVLTATVLLTAGCSFPRSAGGYVTDRFDDALEIVNLKVGFAPSLFVEFRATPFVRVPIGLLGADAWMTSAWVGLIDGKFQQKMADTLIGLPLGQFQLFLLASRIANGESISGGSCPILSWPRPFPPPVRWLDISAELSALARLKLTLSPGQALDFFLGFLCIDIAGDG